MTILLLLVVTVGESVHPYVQNMTQMIAGLFAICSMTPVLSRQVMRGMNLSFNSR
jgi:hypothetical protein